MRGISWSTVVCAFWILLGSVLEYLVDFYRSIFSSFLDLADTFLFSNIVLIYGLIYLATLVLGRTIAGGLYPEPREAQLPSLLFANELKFVTALRPYNGCR